MARCSQWNGGKWGQLTELPLGHVRVARPFLVQLHATSLDPSKVRFARLAGETHDHLGDSTSEALRVVFLKEEKTNLSGLSYHEGSHISHQRGPHEILNCEDKLGKMRGA